MNKIFLTLTCIVMSISSFGQLQQRPIPHVKESDKKHIGARTEAGPLPLPFWDDFSTSRETPDPEKWINSENVWINDAQGINPPTIMMASFDGLQSNGKPYSLDKTSDGLTDVLTSAPIALGAYVVSDNVYLSFYLQARGNGEIPNDNDSIQVEMKDNEGAFQWKWSVKGSSVRLDTFDIVTIKLEDPALFHDDFQFRIRSFGRQSGAFDAWHIDYVYMNHNVTDFNFPDRSLQKKPSSIFNRYWSIPISHFNELPGPYLAYSNSSGYNLFDKLQPSNFSIIATLENLQPDLSYTITKDTLADEIFSSFPNPLITGIRQVPLIANKLLNPAKVMSDTLTKIKVALFMNTDDNTAPDYDPLVYTPLDFRINDTIYTEQILQDYYAYDDGSAEYAAGLNYTGDLVAYKFGMSIPEKDTIVAVDMYFPSSGSEGTQLMDLMVWSNNKGKPGFVLHQEPLSLRPSEGVNVFSRYELNKAVVVQDTFFLGWRQASAGNMDIGLDKNNDTGDLIYFNLDGSWLQNTSVEGSLMIHPVFGNADIISSIEPGPASIAVYPNPTNGLLFFEREVSNITILDTQGKILFQQLGIPVQKIDLESIDNGIYILRFESEGKLTTKRLIKLSN